MTEVVITGGAGFIGSTVASALADAGHRVIVVDDFSTGARAFARDRVAYEGDFADPALWETITREHPGVEAVIHCAARIVVPESVADPLGYYDSNVAKTLEMLDALRRVGLRRVLFSSSAAVYRAADGGAVRETDPRAPASPYARTKAMVEDILADCASAGVVRAIALRYFNPIGADPALRTGPHDPAPSHVLGRLIAAHAAGEPFVITGVDWPTRDGSGLRDFVHVWDVATAHVAAIERFDEVTAASPFRVMNVGAGHGTTVRELVARFAEAVGGEVTWEPGARRDGDAAGAYADITRAREDLGWTPQFTLADGIRDSLAWADRVRTAPLR